jgi:hypothetical protein
MTRSDERGGVVASLLGILVCGGIGGFVAWSVVTAMEIDGVMGAILAAAIGMVVATALWIVGGLLLRAAGIAR